MKITDKRIQEQVSVGDLVVPKGHMYPQSYLCLVGYEADSDFPYFVMSLDDMEILNGYVELLDITEDDFDLYAKNEQLELIIK